MQERTRQTTRTTDGGSPGGLFDSVEPGGTVTVSHGTYRRDLPVGSMTVGAVRQRFHDELDIHPEAVAHVDGEETGEDTTLRAGQILMFVRPSGEKGAH